MESIADEPDPVITEKDVIDRIIQKYESNLFQLPPRKQGHYGLRLFRITGDKRYLNAALYDYYAVADNLHVMRLALKDRNLFDKQIIRFESFISNGKRGKARRATLIKYPEYLFYKELLSYSARLQEYGVDVPDEVLSALSIYNFKRVFTDSVMILAWAAQLANHVYWLKQLDIVDHTDAFKQAFINTYPDSQDHKLLKWQFNNKIYGLTHFIFAASEYYQYAVSIEEHKWIFDYFNNNQKRILTKTSADIIAEVAISHLLVDLSLHPFVSFAKKNLVKQFDVEHSLIPSVSGKIDLVTGEHRNVLTIMLFIWPGKLHAGPYFNQIEETLRYIPQSPIYW